MGGLGVLLVLKPQAGSRSRLLDEGALFFSGLQAEESDRVREKERLLLTKKSTAGNMWNSRV